MPAFLMLKLCEDKCSIISADAVFNQCHHNMGAMLWQRTSWSAVPLAAEEGGFVIAEGPAELLPFISLYDSLGTVFHAL